MVRVGRVRGEVRVLPLLGPVHAAVEAVDVRVPVLDVVRADDGDPGRRIDLLDHAVGPSWPRGPAG